MTPSQGVIMWSHEGLGISDKILKFILVKEILFYTHKSPLGPPVVQCETEIDLICPLSYL